MYFTGYFRDKAGNALSGEFGGVNADGSLAFGPTPTDAFGGFEINLRPGQYGFFSVKGYTDKVIAADELNDLPSSDQGIVIRFEKSTVGLWFIGGIAVATWLIYDAARKRKGVGALSQKDLVPIFWIAGGLIGLSIIRKILIALGIWEDPKSKKLDQASVDPNSAWSPAYWRRSQNYSYTISEAQAKAYAEQIYDAFGMFNDNEEQAIDVFHKMRTKANVSFLADIFSQVYQQDLLTFLRGGVWPQDRLSDSDVTLINDYIANLPNF